MTAESHAAPLWPRSPRPMGPMSQRKVAFAAEIGSNAFDGGISGNKREGFIATIEGARCHWHYGKNGFERENSRW